MARKISCYSMLPVTSKCMLQQKHRPSCRRLESDERKLSSPVLRGRGAAMLFSPTQQHPLAAKVTLGILDHEFYDLIEYQADQPIQSPIFPNLKLTAAQVLATKL